MSAAPKYPAQSESQSAVRDIVDYELLFDCVHCGLCLESCPTYVLTRREMDSPRGRIYLMKALAEGKLELDDSAVRHLDLCLGCRGCETACPSGVHYGQLIERANAWVENNHRRPLGERIKRRLISAIFPNPARLRVLIAPLKLIDLLRLRPLMRRILPGGLAESLDLIPAPGERVSDKAWSGRGPDAGAKLAIVHHGCVAQALADSENRNSENALRAAGYRVGGLGETVCCGALDLHMGNRARALILARRNVRILKRSGASAILSAASGCAAVMANYGELLKDDPDLAEDARAVSSRVRDLATILIEAEAPIARGFTCTVTYHDSCHLAHGLKVREAPRRVLIAIPGVRLIEMAEPDLCCGSAGSYNLTEPEMARDLARRKVDNI
ncbi:MAG: heterodisulfide reductase-related iron-sulfur binding cluster, partial [Candidatus Binataceae bacterium]